MARTANVFARVEPELKEQAESVLDQLGIPMSNAVGMFLRQIVLQKGIPFEMKLPRTAPLTYGSLTKEQFDEDDFFGGRRQQHWHRAPGYRPADCRGHRPGLFRQGADPGQREKAVRRHKGPGAVSGEREGRQELPGLPDHHGAGRPGGKRRGGFRLCHQPGQGI